MRDDAGLRSEQTLFRAMFESSSDGFIVLNEEGRVLFANTAAQRLHWGEIERLVFRAPARDAVSFRAELREHGRAFIELRFSGDGGRARFVSVEATAHDDTHDVIVLR